MNEARLLLKSCFFLIEAEVQGKGGSVRNVLDRFYGKVENGSLSAHKLYFVFQGAAPEKWMLEAGEYTMKRFAGLYGMIYGGIVTSKNEAEKLSKTI